MIISTKFAVVPFDLNEDEKDEKFEVSFWYRWGLMNREFILMKAALQSAWACLHIKPEAIMIRCLILIPIWVWDGDGFGGQ